MASKRNDDKQRKNNTGKRPGGVTGKGFVKNDPRINRYGRPRTLTELRELVKAIGDEPVAEKPEWTRLQLMLRRMYSSKANADSKEILDRGWGKVPQPITLDDMSDVDLSEKIGAVLARIGARLVAPIGERLEGGADTTGGSGGDKPTSV